VQSKGHPGWAGAIDIGSDRAENLSVDIGRVRGTVVVTVRGEIGPAGSELLGELLSDLIDGQGNRNVTVDLAAAAVVPSLLDVFAGLADRANARGGRFVVSAPDMIRS
jgi:anti-anti-sigma regulatory factor